MARKVTTDAKPPSLEKKGLLKEALKGDGAEFYRSWLTYFRKAEGDGAKFYKSWLAYFRKTKDWLEDDTIIKCHAALITVAAGWLGAIAFLFDCLRSDSQELEKRNDVLKLVDRATASSKLFSILASSQLSLANAKLSTLVGTDKLQSWYDLEEEMCNAQKRGSGGSSSKMRTDAHNYSFDRSSSNRRQWLCCLFGSLEINKDKMTKSVLHCVVQQFVGLKHLVVFLF